MNDNDFNPFDRGNLFSEEKKDNSDSDRGYYGKINDYAEREDAPSSLADEKEDYDNEDDGDESVSLPSMLFDIAETLSYAACIIVLLFTFVFRVAIVSGPSMENTLFNQNMILVSDLNYTPKYGDIVVFQKLKSNLGEEAVVKRVIATEGQTVDIDFETWTLTVDGKAVDESLYRYLDPKVSTRLSDFDYPITLGKGELFVMGDNRNHSTDSRSLDLGIVDERCVIGRVLLRFYPLSEFTIFNRFS